MYFRVTEYWEPKKEELERLKVTKKIPRICILLSKGSETKKARNKHKKKKPSNSSS